MQGYDRTKCLDKTSMWFAAGADWEFDMMSQYKVSLQKSLNIYCLLLQSDLYLIFNSSLLRKLPSLFCFL